LDRAESSERRVNMESEGRKENRKPLKKVLREWAESFSIAIVLALGIKVFFFEIYKIPTSSMEPTLIGRLKGGDRIIVNKVKYRFSSPRRWDVFVFHSPAGEGKNLIKRVTGLPGETICIKNGDVYINGKPVPEEKPSRVQEALYFQIEDITFSDETWRYRFKPVRLDPVAVSRGGGKALRIVCRGAGRLVYTRPITNFYLRKGAGKIRCVHRYGETAYYPVPEASTLNSLIKCPAPGCGKMVDLFTLKNTTYGIDILQEKSLKPGEYEPLRYDNTPVGDMKVTYRLRCVSCTGYVGCVILENRIEYVFLIAGSRSGRQSKLVIRDRFTKRIIARDIVPFSLYEGFDGGIAFENCDNRESVYVKGEKVYSRVFDDPLLSAGPKDSGLILLFKGFRGEIDDVKLYRDVYYTNVDNWMMDGTYAVDPARPLRLGRDEYFAMGDNSSNSRDSRYFGPVKRRLIMGNGFMVFPWFTRYFPPRFSHRWKVVH